MVADQQRRPAPPAGAARRTAATAARRGPPTPAASTPPSSPVSTSRTRASAAHSCAAGAPTTAVADVDARVRRRRLPQRADAAGRAACVTRPESGGWLPRQHAQQRGLAVAVAADDADPVAVVEAQRDAVQQRAPGVGDADRLDVQQVRHQAMPSSRRQRSRTGSTIAGPRDRPEGPPHAGGDAGRGQRDRDVQRVLAARRRGTRRSARSRTRRRRARRPGGRPPACAPAPGPARHAAALQVVGERRAERGRVAGAQRLHERGPRPPARGRRSAARSRSISRVDGGGREPVVGERDHPVVLAARQRRGEPLAAAGADRRAAEQRERDVGAELRGQQVQIVAGEAGPPQRVAGDQRGRGVRGPAGHAAGHRDPLAQVQVDAVVDPDPLGDAGRRRAAPGSCRPAARARPACPSTVSVISSAGSASTSSKSADGVEHRGELVVAVGTRRAHPQLEVDLRGRADGHATRSPHRAHPKGEPRDAARRGRRARPRHGRETLHRQALPAVGRVDARGPQRRLGGGGRAGPAGQRGAQRLAPLRERRVDARRTPAPAWRSSAAAPGG